MGSQFSGTGTVPKISASHRQQEKADSIELQNILIEDLR